MGVLRLRYDASYSVSGGEEASSFAHDLVDFMRELVATALDYPMLYALRKATDKVCIPLVTLRHSPRGGGAYTDHKVLLRKIAKGERFTAPDKLSATMDVALAYAMMRCAKTHRVAILPLGVATREGGPIDHANILVLDFRQGGRMVRPYLYEPNGEAFAAAHSTATPLVRALARTQRLLHEQKLEVQPLRVIGGRGLQSALGTKVRERNKTVGMEGCPVCAAVGYWLVLGWLQHGGMDLDKYLQRIWSRLENQPESRIWMRKDLLQFIDATRRLNEDRFHNALSHRMLRGIDDFMDTDRRYASYGDDFRLTVDFGITSTSNRKFQMEATVGVDNSGVVDVDGFADVNTEEQCWFSPVAP